MIYLIRIEIVGPNSGSCLLLGYHEIGQKLKLLAAFKISAKILILECYTSGKDKNCLFSDFVVMLKLWSQNICFLSKKSCNL